MPATFDVPLTRRGFGETRRPDAWWVTPAAVFTVLSAFLIYATWAAFQNAHYTYGPYLSPFYSPEIWGDSPHAWLGSKPGWWPGWLPFSPALLILGVPAGFRMTCYYYRGAYYKSFWADPPSCAVGEPRKSYLGERSFPLILQNFHRYFLYLSILFVCVLWYDAIKAFFFADGFGIGVGSIVLLANVILLSCYTFGCHSLRHIAGGFRDRLSETPSRRTAYECVSALNCRHMRFAWMSLFTVAFSDIYVRMCSMGVWTDWRLV